MEFVALDFETFYSDEYTLNKLTTSEYVFDPRFEVIGVGVIFRGKRYWMEEHQFRVFVRMVDWSKFGMLCHHAQFDGLILAHHYGVFPGYWLDTLSMGRALYGSQTMGNSLEKLMERLGVGRKLTERMLVAKGKRRADFTPEEWASYGEYCLNDNEGALACFQKMMEAGFPRAELDLIDITVRMFTEPVLVLDQQMLAEYQQEELARKNELLRQAFAPDLPAQHVSEGLLEAWVKELRSNDKFAAVLRYYDVEPGMKDSPTAKHEDGTPKRTYAFAKTDPAMQELLESEDDDVRLLAEARVQVKSTLNESRTTRMMKLGEGGRALCVYLKYAAAHTIRWGGGDKVNWQNFEKTNKLNPKKGMIRKAVRAPKKMKIVKADASQVEARYNAWHSGEGGLVRQFALGEDVYSSFASDAYGRPVDRKKNKADEQPGQVAKICVLGLGYRMGWPKLAAEFLMGRGGAPKVQFDRTFLERLQIDPAPFLRNPRNIDTIKNMPSRLPEAERMIHCCVTNYFVERYRSKYKMISGNWEFWDKVIEWMYAGQHYGPVGYLGILTHVEGGLRMPNGFILRYPHIEYKKGEGFTFLSGKGKRSKLHGGIIVENYTQALCRQIVADAMIRLTWGRQRAGLKPWKVAQTEHDAILCVVPEEEAGQCLNDLMREISTPPKWAPGLPLAAEGGIYDTMGG